MEAIDILAGYAVFAVALMVFGLGYKILRMIWLRSKMKREMTPRTKTLHPVKKMPYLEAIKRVNYDSFMRFWAKANPPTFTAHLIYHVAVGTAILSYALSFATLLMLGKIPIINLSVPETLVYVFDWFSKFSQENYALLNSPMFTQIFIYLFEIALVLGITAELITLTLSKLKMRGMIRQIDVPTEILKIKTSGLQRSTKGGWPRKIIGLMVLGIVVPLFLQFQGLLDENTAFYIHTTFALTFMAIFPYTMLFHEVARWRMWAGVARMQDRRTA